MALPPMGPMSPPSPFLGGPQQNMGPPPFPPMPQMGGGMGMAPPMGPPPMGPPPINPVNPASDGQSFGGNAGGRKTFSQYLQSMNTSFPPTPPVTDPMAGGIGGGAPSMPPLAMMGGGAVPRQTMIANQPHMLAYINPGEEMMLRDMGGTGQPGPGGVPAYPPGGYGGGFGGGGGGFGGGPGGYGGYDGGFGEAGRGGPDSNAPGMGPGDFGGGPGDGDRGDIDIGFVNALADQVAEEQEAAAIAESNEMMSPLGGADAIARSNLVDSFMDTKDGRDLAMFNDSTPYTLDRSTSPSIDTLNALTASSLGTPFSAAPIATDNIISDDVEISSDPTQAYLDSLTKPSIQTGANNFIDAVAMQKNDPNQSTTGPLTGFNILDAANLSSGTVTPNMMPPGYQPTPNEPTFDDLTFDADQISINPLDNIPSTLGSPIDPVVGLGTTVDPDLNYSLPVAATPADPNFDQFVSNKAAVGRPIDRISPTLGAPIAPDYGDLNIDMGTDNLGGVAGIQDPSFIAGMNQADANIAAPTLSDSYLGQLGIPDFTPTSPQLDESARDEVVDYNTARDIAAQNERNQQSLSNLNLDTSGLGIDASGMTPTQLSSYIANLDAGMGAAIAANDGFITGAYIDPAFGSANVADLGFDQGMGAAINQGNANMYSPDIAPYYDDTISSIPVEGTTLSPEITASNQAALANLDLSTKGLGLESNLSLDEIDGLVDARIDIQKELDNAGFNPLSLVPFGSLLGTSASRRQKGITQVLNQSGGSGILGSGIGGSTGVLGTGAVTFNAVYDADGKFVGSQGVTKSGETVSYMGDIQGNKGYYDSNGKNISKTIEGYQEEIGGQGSPGGIDVDYNPCQPGYELDPETGTCVPIDVVGGGDSSGTSTLGSVIRPTTRTPRPVPEPVLPVTSPTLVRPKQFNMGGATSGSNLDGAIGRLLSSMS